ncbi:MAG: hypothetical protein J6R22_00025 [Alphaproteobacteria bacterium]|nr:hypothetical protein [Alphaproteobacteria bacterium]
MGQFIKTQNSFANGEVSSQFYATDNINGLSKLENMDVLSSGCISRREGLATVAALYGPARLISFSTSEGSDYLLALTDYHMLIFYQDKLYQDLASPWSYEQVKSLQYAQRFGTMIFVHPEYRPQVLSKGASRFDISDFTFATNDADLSIYMPFIRFTDASGVKITVSPHEAGNNFATFATNKDFWTADNVTGRLYLLGKQWIITDYISPTKVTAYTNGTYTLPSGPVSDWTECAFGLRRGWPRSITFHQDRLVFGGSRDWPCGIWMSKVGQHTNFDLGTGLDDEAIFINLLSDKNQHICTVVSSDNLQILTSVGEWAISCKPLTPSSVDIRQHTSVGSSSAHYLPPQKIEGSTVFLARNGRDIRELSLDDLGEKYNANDLSLFAKHLINDPIDMAYNSYARRLFVVDSGGDMAVLNHNSSLGISAWSSYTTNGKFISVATCGNDTYVTVGRSDNDFYLEKFSKDTLYDAEYFCFPFCAAGLPLRASNHNARRLKLHKIGARVLDTKSISINEYRIALPNETYATESNGYSGDVSVGLLGTYRECIKAPWKIHGDQPQPITVLSVTMYGTYIV